MQNLLIQPGPSLNGTIRVDGDKSISHRSIMFGAIANGVTTVKDLLEGEDVLATVNAFRAMGVRIEQIDDRYVIEGAGRDGLKQPDKPLDMGNSGTAFRLLAGILTGQPWESVLCGDQSLSGRPMGRIIRPLGLMGGSFSAIDEKPPITIHGNPQLKSIRYVMPMASAQVKSAVLLAGLYAEGETAVKEPAPTRDHTERMLRGFGYSVTRQGEWVSLVGGGQLNACDITVPADLSSATFFILGALISPDSRLELSKVGINPSRNGVLAILKRMGASIELKNEHIVGGEPVADIVVSSSSLEAIEIGSDDIALAVDEIPAVAVAAACAQGVTRIRGAEELRVKESDRIATTVAGLKALGISVTEHQDGMTIVGGKIQQGQVSSEGDHRIAMAFTMAANIANGPVTVHDTECINTSFPGFRRLAASTGMLLSD